MKKDEIQPTFKLLSSDAARQRRFYVDLANADEDWQQTKASFALSGLATTREDEVAWGKRLAEGDAGEALG